MSGQIGRKPVADLGRRCVQGVFRSRSSRRDIIRYGMGIAGALAAPAIVHAQAGNKIDKAIVAGLNGKAGDPTYESIARIAPILKQKFNIDADIQVHPSSVLGTDLQQLEAVQMGYIDVTSNVTAQFTSFSDAFAFADLPYAIPSWEFFHHLVTSDLWKQQVARFEAKLPLKVLPPVGAGGFRILWNSKRAVPAPAAVNGLKFRTTASPLEVDLIRNWGGNPTPMAFTETYNALANGVVDGIHVQPIWTYNFRMQEVLKYGTEVKAIFAVQLQVMNRKTWDALGSDVQTAFAAAAQEAAEQANAIDEASEQTYKGKLREAGMQLYTPSAEEIALWRKSGEAVWEGAGRSVDSDVVKAMLSLR
jgi:TRAP-type C4-dicarboxylate transport system substrate-binding protein